MIELKNLLPQTEQVLLKIANLEVLSDFTFVGGSALSVYLKHRLSEDIDMFTWQKQINAVEIQNQLNTLNFDDVRIVNFSTRQADFVIDHVKVTFFANDWDELKNRTLLKNNLYIADLKTIAIMKVNTLFLRAKFRDYYDLYVLNRHHFTIAELFEMALSKMKNLNKTLFQKAIIFTDDIDDENINHLSPMYNVTLKQIESHFIKQIKSWNKASKNK